MKKLKNIHSGMYDYMLIYLTCLPMEVFSSQDLVRTLIESPKKSIDILRMLLNANIVSLQDIRDVACQPQAIYDSIVDIIELLVDENMIDREFVVQFFKHTLEKNWVYKQYNKHNSKKLFELLVPYLSYPLEWNILAQMPSEIITDYLNIDTIKLDEELLDKFVRIHVFNADMIFHDKIMNKLIDEIDSNTNPKLVIKLGISLFSRCSDEQSTIIEKYVLIIKEIFGEEFILNMLFEASRKGSVTRILVKYLLIHECVTSLPIYDYYAIVCGKLNKYVSDRLRKYHKYMCSYFDANAGYWDTLSVSDEDGYEDYDDTTITFGLSFMYDGNSYTSSPDCNRDDNTKINRTRCTCVSDQIDLLNVALDIMEADSSLNEYIDSPDH